MAYVKRTYTVTRTDTFRTSYACAACGLNVPVEISAKGTGESSGMRSLDNQWIAEEANARARRAAMWEAKSLLPIAPCPRCGKRQGMGGFWFELVFLMLLAPAGAIVITRVMMPEAFRGLVFDLLGGIIALLVAAIVLRRAIDRLSRGRSDVAFGEPYPPGYLPAAVPAAPSSSSAPAIIAGLVGAIVLGGGGFYWFQKQSAAMCAEGNALSASFAPPFTTRGAWIGPTSDPTAVARSMDHATKFEDAAKAHEKDVARLRALSPLAPSANKAVSAFATEADAGIEVLKRSAIASRNRDASSLEAAFDQWTAHAKREETLHAAIAKACE